MEGGSYWTIEYFLDRELAATVDEATVVRGSLEKAKENLDAGLIDDLANIHGAPVYILSGNYDDVCPKKFQQAQRTVYETYGANIVYEAEDFGHVFPVDYPTD